MMREKNWWKEHRAGIRNALIGAAVIGVAVGGWGFGYVRTVEPVFHD